LPRAGFGFPNGGGLFKSVFGRDGGDGCYLDFPAALPEARVRIKLPSAEKPCQREYFRLAYHPVGLGTCGRVAAIISKWLT
jgi:hypothetical protein